MECITTEHSEVKSKKEDPANKQLVPNEPAVQQVPLNVIKVEKNEEERGSKWEQSDHEGSSKNRDMENVLGVLGKFLYNQRRRKGRMRKRPITKKTKRLNLRNRTLARQAGRAVQDGVCDIGNRNWKKLSIYPIVNFMRDFRKTIPKQCPPETMAVQANQIWAQMDREEKLPFIMKAARALQNGYYD